VCCLGAVTAVRSGLSVQSSLTGVILFVACIWIVFLLDRVLPLEHLGLVPRQLRGLVGIAAMPFLHGDLPHLISNTPPLIFLMLLLVGSRAASTEVVVLLLFVSGILLWVFGREALHIGASTLVFSLGSFLVVTGMMERRALSLGISLLVVLLYGTSFLTGILPWQPGVSWDGHLAGLIGGCLVAPVAMRRVQVKANRARNTDGR